MAKKIMISIKESVSIKEAYYGIIRFTYNHKINEVKEFDYTLKFDYY